MSEARCFRAYGRSIDSDLDLALPVRECGEPDLTIRTSTGEAHLSTAPWDVEADEVVACCPSSDGGTPWYLVTEEGDRYRLRIRDTGEFHISRDLQHVWWVPQPSGFSHLGSVLAAGTLQALMLVLSGQLVLHASAVEVSGRAIAFVGQSGRGKSTTAALCAAAGASVVSDDVLLVELRPDGVWCRGSGGELRLREKAKTVAELFARDASRAPTVDDRTSLTIADRQAGWVQLDAIAVPYPERDRTSVEAASVPETNALFGLLGYPRIEGLRGGLLDRQFQLHAELVKQVPVLQVQVPWGPPWRVDVGRELLAALGRARRS